MCIGSLASSAGLDDLGVRHDGDIGVPVTGVLDDTPTQPRKEVLSAGRKKINCGIAACCRFANGVLSECAADATPPMSKSNKDTSEPRSELWMRVHFTMNEH